MAKANATVNAQAAQAGNVLVTGATFSGQGNNTVCTLTVQAQAAVQPGTISRAAVRAYYAAHTANQGRTGYVKGTQAYYQYLAWAQVACGGHIATAANRYCNPQQATPNATSKPGHLVNGTGNPHRLSQHMLWVLKGVVANQNANLAQATGTAG